MCYTDASNNNADVCSCNVEMEPIESDDDTLTTTANGFAAPYLGLPYYAEARYDILVTQVPNRRTFTLIMESSSAKLFNDHVSCVTHIYDSKFPTTGNYILQRDTA